MGRPSDYTDEVALEICAQIAEGKSLRSICKAEGLPSLRTVMRWLNEREAFQQQYARAREDQADSLADELIDIADRDDLDPNDKRVRLDARKWAASKLKPKKYGDRLELDGAVQLNLSERLRAARERVKGE